MILGNEAGDIKIVTLKLALVDSCLDNPIIVIVIANFV